MRINKLIPIHNAGSLELGGLQFNEMNNLGKVVALFGKNGAGKSRLLKYVRSFVGEISRMRNDPMHNIPLSKFSLNDSEGLIDGFDRSGIIVIEPGLYETASPDNMSESSYREDTILTANNPVYKNVREQCLQIIKALFKAELTSKYPEVIGESKVYTRHDKQVKRNSHLLNSIKYLVEKFTGKEISCHYDEFSFPSLIYGGVTLNQYTTWPSDGELELIAMSVYFALQEDIKDDSQLSSNVIKDKIIIIDEPELFLHPEAQISVIKRLKELVGNGQIWLATHSLPLLAIFEREEIWLLKEGRVISPSIETPGEAMSQLIGGENVFNLEGFLSSQYEWAAIKFALESLFPPDQASYKKTDPQQNQVINYLGVPVHDMKILDFGAGNGRIGHEILRNSAAAKKIYYQALEDNKGNKEQLEEISKRLQKESEIDNDCEREVLNSFKKLGEAKYNTFYDRVLLINVLHEVPIHHWAEVLKGILGSLKSDGKILILEDQHLPKGENAHEFGYLILNIEEFQLLFNLANKPKQFLHPDEKYRDRLLCIEINKCDATVDHESIHSALLRKKNNCHIEICELKEKVKPTAREGRAYQFYAQLYYNVDCALSAIKPMTSN